jgi:hypothetical protein
MMPYVRIVASREKTRVVMTLGMGEVLKANLPPLWQIKHQRAATTLLEALSLWSDGRVCVALSADDSESCFRLGLIDALGEGTRTVFHELEVVPLRPRRHRRHAAAEPSPGNQLRLVTEPGGQR